MNHHDFSPSKLEQFRICPGSYQMQLGIPDQPSEASLEGTILHNRVATGNTDGLTSEQIDLVEKCNEFLKTIIGGGSIVQKEKTFDVLDNDGIILTYGTADVVIVDPTGDDLIAVDWKFGYTPVNDVENNIQLATYAVGAMQKYDRDHCDCWVFQPRIHRKSHHVFTNRAAIIANIKNIIKRAQSDSMVLHPSEDSCRYCRARLNCPAFRVKFQKLAASRGDCDLSNISTLETLFDASKSVKSFLNEIEAAVKNVIEANGRCGKYGFQVSEGSREVKDLNMLYSAVSDLVTPREFNDVCKVTLGKFETLVADKLIAEANAKGEKLSKNSAKQRCYAKIADLITRGTPTKKIVELP